MTTRAGGKQVVRRLDHERIPLDVIQDDIAEYFASMETVGAPVSSASVSTIGKAPMEVKAKDVRHSLTRAYLDIESIGQANVNVNDSIQDHDATDRTESQTAEPVVAPFAFALPIRSCVALETTHREFREIIETIASSFPAIDIDELVSQLYDDNARLVDKLENIRRISAVWGRAMSDEIARRRQHALPRTIRNGRTSMEPAEAKPRDDLALDDTQSVTISPRVANAISYDYSIRDIAVLDSTVTQPAESVVAATVSTETIVQQVERLYDDDHVRASVDTPKVTKITQSVQTHNKSSLTKSIPARRAQPPTAPMPGPNRRNNRRPKVQEATVCALRTTKASQARDRANHERLVALEARRAANMVWST